jgi:hypothetical protein
MTELDTWRQRFAGQPFGAVFSQPRRYPPNRWRVRRSGVHFQPEDAPTTAAVFAVCEALGIQIAFHLSGGPCSASAWPFEAYFLDGGVSGQTGNYLPGERGAEVTGPRAVLLLALALGLRVRPGWLVRYGLEGVELDDLVAEVRREQRRRVRGRQREQGLGVRGFLVRDKG